MTDSSMNQAIAGLQSLNTTFSGTNFQGTSGTFAVMSSFTQPNSTVTGSEVSQYQVFSSGTNQYGCLVNFTARTAVSGGNLICPSGTGPQGYAAGAFTGNAPAPVIGVAVNSAPVASGGTFPCLVYGVATLTASAGVTIGQYVTQCSGTDAIISVATPTANTFGRALDTVTSGNTVAVLLL